MQAQTSWPKLQTSLDAAPALIRTPNAMNHFYPISLNVPGPSSSEKGKSRELLNNTSAPSWYPVTAAQPVTSREKADAAEGAEGSWWSAVTKDEAYIGGIPWTPGMTSPQMPKVRRIKGKKRRKNASQRYFSQPPLPRWSLASIEYTFFGKPAICKTWKCHTS